MLHKHCLITQLPSDGWYEGSARRSDGKLLITRADYPELYELDPEDPEAEPEIIYTFDREDATGILNISAIPGIPDEFYVLTADVDLVNVQIDNHRVWRLRVSSSSPKPQLEPVFNLPEGCGVVSIEAATKDQILFGDQFNDCIHLLDMRGGKNTFTPLVKGQDYFTPPGADSFFGINRIRVHGGYMWYTNSGRGVLGRIPIGDLADAAGFKVTGDHELVTDELEQTDGLVISADSRTAYVNCMSDGTLVQIEMSPAAGGKGVKAKVKAVVEELINPTALLFTPGDSADQQNINVVCSGAVEVAWRDSHSSESWAGFADTINGSVSVSVETTVETYNLGKGMSRLQIQ